MTAPESILVCPVCHRELVRSAVDHLVCKRCCRGFPITDGIVTVASRAPSFFDRHYPDMMHSTDEQGSYLTFYAEQGRIVRDRLAGAMTILDVGCGPRIHYLRPTGSLLIGLDRSYESLKRNLTVDLRLFGSATKLPLPRSSVDAIVCLYSLHHMIGATIRETEANVQRAFQEFRRVLRPSGSLLVFEVSPRWGLGWVQQLAWPLARLVLGSSLDVFFWRWADLSRLAGPGWRLDEYRVLAGTPGVWFPFVASLHRFRLPRALYPFHVSFSQWTPDR